MATQVVSKFTTLDRFVAEVERVIEAADPTAQVVALDFRSPTIAQRDSRSAGTHSLTGWSDEGYRVRGAADINVRKKGTTTPHPREWELLNKYAKPRAIKYGLAYTFPKSPTIWLGSHSGPSLHLHADVSVWGTDYGNPYTPFVSGKGGYYRQKHAGNPTALPPPIKRRTTSTSTGGFPLPDGVNYAENDGTWRTRSGANPVDRPNIKRIQSKVGVTQDGFFGPKTTAAVKVKQKSLGITVDGKVGPTTWKRLGL